MGVTVTALLVVSSGARISSGLLTPPMDSSPIASRTVSIAGSGTVVIPWL